MDPGHSPFLEIPLEIRCMIYELVSHGQTIVDDFKSGRGIFYKLDPSSLPRSRPTRSGLSRASRYFALCLVNKQLRKELRASRCLLLKNMKITIRQDYFTRCWRNTNEVPALTRDRNVVKTALRICLKVELVGHLQHDIYDFPISDILNRRSKKPELTMSERFWNNTCSDDVWHQPSGIRAFLSKLGDASTYHLRFRITQRSCSARLLHTGHEGCAMLEWLDWCSWYYDVAYFEFIHDVPAAERYRANCSDGSCRGKHKFTRMTAHVNEVGWKALRKEFES